MIRALLITVFTVFAFMPTIQAADPFESTACVSGSMNVIHQSEQLITMSMDLKGIVRSDTNSEILNNASEWCVGLYNKMGNETTQRGFCKYLYPEGDINVIEFNGDANGGDWKFLLGTGKWEGIKGGGTYTVTQRAKSIAPGTFQNCRQIKGTYELAK
jgi:hypothetical protein